MKHRIFLCGMLLLTAPLSAQTWSTGALNGNALALPGGCSATWYDPEAIIFPDGNPGFLAQGGMINPCTANTGLDSLFRAKYNISTQSWQIPAANSCPTLVGTYASTVCPGQELFQPYQPLGSPAITKVGGKYYMAFTGGNADIRKGHVFWAVSTDGINWTIFNGDPKPAGFAWKPLIYPKYRDLCERFGISQLTLTYDPNTNFGPEGTFYLHLLYWHPDGAPDTYIFRLPYSSANAFGLGGPMQVCINGGPRGSTCSWMNHSGAIVFNYDMQPPVAGDPLLTGYDGNKNNFLEGAGTIAWDPSHNNWLRVFTYFDQYLYWQTSTSLSSGVWTAPAIVDMTRFKSQVLALYPGADVSGFEYYGGLHWGSIGTRTGMWLFQPARHVVCPNDPGNGFLALGIFTVELCSGDSPTISGVSPATGPSGGGTSVQVLGTNLDCASSVQFGGTAATITSKAPGAITVTTPAHAAGVVNVVVTTPAGTATRPSGFTYMPPVYEGYHEILGCYYTVGWAWDSNWPNNPINVDVYDGIALLGSTLANGFRQDLLNAGKGNGYHGFSFSLPSSVRNGSAHNISVKFGGTATNLTWSPRSVTCQSLSVSKAGTGVGTVTSNPAGISCGGDCSEFYSVNTSVTLTASPGSGSTFGGWSGNADCSDGVVTLSANRSCTATFAAAVRVIWLQPQALAGFGTPGSLVMAGSATNAPPGTSVRVTWRDVTAGGPWTTEPYQPSPDANGIWYHEILNANYSHQYAVTATFGVTTSVTCTYPGNGMKYNCP